VNIIVHIYSLAGWFWSLYMLQSYQH